MAPSPFSSHNILGAGSSSIPIFRYRFLSANHNRHRLFHLHPSTTANRSPIQTKSRNALHQSSLLDWTQRQVWGSSESEPLAIHTDRYDIQTIKFIFPGFTNTTRSPYSPGRGKRPGLNIAGHLSTPCQSVHSQKKKKLEDLQTQAFHSGPLHTETHPCWSVCRHSFNIHSFILYTVAHSWSRPWTLQYLISNTVSEASSSEPPVSASSLFMLQPASALDDLAACPA